MNAKHIESRFAAMGARLKVREIASRWQMGNRKWIDRPVTQKQSLVAVHKHPDKRKTAERSHPSL